MELTSDKIIVVIRSAGERTLNACVELVLREVDPSLLHVVELVPFEEALRACYKIGIQSEAKWMMTLDADVLLRENAIRDFVVEAEHLPTSYFHIEGLIFDKLTGQYRKAGHRLYRIDMLEEALSLIPSDGEAIRPEFTTISRMKDRGYLVKESGTVFGIHDFEQYYKDVYRKCIVHAQKHTEWIPRLIERWKVLSPKDADFVVALRALYDGLMQFDDAKIDKRLYEEGALLALKNLNLPEKRDFEYDLNLVSRIRETLNEAGPVPAEILPDQNDSYSKSRSAFFKRKVREVGIINTLSYILGLMFSKIGQKLKDFGS